MPLQKLTAFFRKFPTIDLPKDQIIVHYEQPITFIYLVKSGFLECNSIFNRQGNSFPLAIVPPEDIIPLIAITHTHTHVLNTLSAPSPQALSIKSL